VKFLILSFCLLLLPAGLQAKVSYDINDPDVVAQVGELTLSPQLIEIFWRAYNHPSRPITPPQAMQRIVDDALLADHARSHLSAEQLAEENQVGFLVAVQQQDRATALLRKFFEKPLYQAIKQLPGGSLDGTFQLSDAINSDWLKQHFSLQSKVRIEATQAQVERAKQTTLATLTFDGEQQPLTLWDIYQRQNVQGRLALLSGDYNYLVAQVRQRVGSLFVLHWAEKNMSARDYRTVFQVIRNEHDKTTLLKNMGLYADVHDDNPVLREKATQVSEAEILAFYKEDKDEFEVVEKVKARHIRLTSQQQADAVHDEIKQGLAFEDAVKKYSVADDKHKKPAGDLGWLKRKDKDRSWLHAVAFTQPEGAVSMPFRSPQNAGEIVYEILYIDERVDGYLPVSDPTVRYEASRDVALKKLKSEFFQLQNRLRQQADISLNKKALQR